MNSYIYKIVDFGESIYFSFVEVWNWLFTPIVLYESNGMWELGTDGYYHLQQQDDLSSTIDGFNKLFGLLFDRQVEEISFMPIQFLLVGLTTIILVKLIAVVVDAVPWL